MFPSRFIARHFKSPDCRLVEPSLAVSVLTHLFDPV